MNYLDRVAAKEIVKEGAIFGGTAFILFSTYYWIKYLNLRHVPDTLPGRGPM